MAETNQVGLSGTSHEHADDIISGVAAPRVTGSKKTARENNAQGSVVGADGPGLGGWHAGVGGAVLRKRRKESPARPLGTPAAIGVEGRRPNSPISEEPGRHDPFSPSKQPRGAWPVAFSIFDEGRHR